MKVMMSRGFLALWNFVSMGSLLGILRQYSVFPLALPLMAAVTPVFGADIRPEKVFTASTRKMDFYVRDGLVIGGDRAVEEVLVRDIRRSGGAKYERVVVDLQGIRNGEPLAIPRPPYFQVAVNPDEKRLLVSVWGRPKLGFDPKVVESAFKRSSNVKEVQLLPRLEDQIWTFAVQLKKGRSVEVFELTDPVRLIIDIKSL